MPKGKQLTDEEQRLVVQLCNDGFCPTKIAKIMHRSRGAVRYYIKHINLPRKPRGELYSLMKRNLI